VIEELLCDGEDPEERKRNWDLKLNKEDIKVYIKKAGGSKYNKEHPFVRSEILFKSAFSMRKVIDSVR
jgi:hypothetical protein